MLRCPARSPWFDHHLIEVSSQTIIVYCYIVVSNRVVANTTIGFTQEPVRHISRMFLDRCRQCSGSRDQLRCLCFPCLWMRSWRRRVLLLRPRCCCLRFLFNFFHSFRVLSLPLPFLLLGLLFQLLLSLHSELLVSPVRGLPFRFQNHFWCWHEPSPWLHSRVSIFW